MLEFFVLVLLCWKNSRHLQEAQVLGFRSIEKKPIPCSKELPLWVQSREKAGGLWLECLPAGGSYDTHEETNPETVASELMNYTKAPNTGQGG